jgi:hypothetical protein
MAMMDVGRLHARRGRMGCGAAISFLIEAKDVLAVIAPLVGRSLSRIANFHPKSVAPQA